MKRLDKIPIGKTMKSLEYSAQLRKNFFYRMGIDEMPHSILFNDRSERAIDLIVKEGGRSATFNVKDNKRRVSDEDRHLKYNFEISGKSVRAGKDAVLSRFPQNVGKILVRFYCHENGIVYDPFAGHNSRMQLTYESRRTYIGVDISHEFMEANRQIKEILEKRERFDLDVEATRNTNTITLLEQSSDNVRLLEDNFADFTITSPPYWDLEYYGDEPEQLGNAKTFDKFIELISEHVKENYRILKPGSYCAWFINNFVKKKKFYNYLVRLNLAFEEAGFEIYDIYVVDLGRPLAESFVRSVISSERYPKRHEYCILAKKPGTNLPEKNHIRNLINT